jgi:O-antigen ligase
MTNVTASVVNFNKLEDVWRAIWLLPILSAGSVLKPSGVQDVLGLDVTVASLLLLLCVASKRLIERPVYPVKYFYPLFAFGVLIIIAIGSTDLSGQYQQLKIRDSLSTAMIVLLLPVLLRNREDFRGLINVWLLAAVAASAVVLLMPDQGNLGGRSGIGDATLGPAYLIATGVVIAIAGWVEGMIPGQIAAVLTVLMTVALFGIGSRGPVLGVVVGLLTWALMSSGRSSRQMFSVVVLLTVAAYLAIRLAPAASTDRLFDYEDIKRLDLWRSAYNLYLDRPLLGVGWGQYSVNALQVYPHNLFLEVAAELGTLGLLLLLAILIAAATRSWRLRSVREVRVVASIAAMAFAGQQFSGDLSNRMFWISLAPTLLVSATMADSGGGAVSASSASVSARRDPRSVLRR